MELELFSNEINTIEASSFHFLTNVTEMKLSKNRLKQLKQGMFSNMIHLKTLSLENNQIDTIENEAVFQDLTSLTRLSLLGNKLKSFKVSFMLDKLNFLLLESNQLVQIAIELPNLKYLIASSNQIRELVPSSFSKCHELLMLDLSKNRIAKIGGGGGSSTFKNLAKLIYLNLSSNYLDGLDENVFAGLDSLKVLDLSFNYLKILDKYFLRNMFSINELRLNNNQMTKIEPGSFNSLMFLLILRLEFNLLGISTLQIPILSNQRLFAEELNLR